MIETSPDGAAFDPKKVVPSGQACEAESRAADDQFFFFSDVAPRAERLAKQIHAQASESGPRHRGENVADAAQREMPSIGKRIGMGLRERRRSGTQGAELVNGCVCSRDGAQEAYK